MVQQADWSADDMPDLAGRVALVTGASSGLGKEAARVLAQKGAQVILAVRNIEKGSQVLAELEQQTQGNLTLRQLDLAEQCSIARFCDTLLAEFSQLNVLINNAGAVMCPYAQTADGFEMQMGTNHLGHFALTGRLLPLLKQTPDARITMVASISHHAGNIDLDDLNWTTRQYNSSKAYGDSKLANLYFAYEFARRFADDPSAPIITAAHPGWTDTASQPETGWMSVIGKLLAQDVAVGALPILRAAVDSDAQAGDYFGPSKFFGLHGSPVKIDSSKRSQDEAIAAALWAKSETLTGMTIS